MPYKDKEKRREWLKQYRLEHKEYFQERNKQHREKNRERIREIGRNYYHRHKSEKKEIKCERNKQYRITHKEYFQEYLKKYREEQKLKALQAIKNTAKEILIQTNQNFINNNPSQAKKITKKEFKNQIFKQIYEIMGTPEGWNRFCQLLNKQIAENILSKYEE